MVHALELQEIDTHVSPEKQFQSLGWLRQQTLVGRLPTTGGWSCFAWRQETLLSGETPLLEDFKVLLAIRLSCLPGCVGESKRSGSAPRPGTFPRGGEVHIWGGQFVVALSRVADSYVAHKGLDTARPICLSSGALRQISSGRCYKVQPGYTHLGERR